MATQANKINKNYDKERFKNPYSVTQEVEYLQEKS